MDNSIKETWIDKLVDELVDAKDAISEREVDRNQLDNLVRIILNSSRLDYGGEGLRIENDGVIFGFLQAIYPESYKTKLAQLKAAQEAEFAKVKAEVAATDEEA